MIILEQKARRVFIFLTQVNITNSKMLQSKQQWILLITDTFQESLDGPTGTTLVQWGSVCRKYYFPKQSKLTWQIAVHSRFAIVWNWNVLGKVKFIFVNFNLVLVAGLMNVKINTSSDMEGGATNSELNSLAHVLLLLHLSKGCHFILQ